MEWWTAATGDAGAGASAAAEWDDRGEHDYTSLGCSPTHLAVPLIPRHAGGGDGGRQAEVEKRLEWLTQSAGGAEERLWRMSELGSLYYKMSCLYLYGFSLWLFIPTLPYQRRLFITKITKRPVRVKLAGNRSPCKNIPRPLKPPTRPVKPTLAPTRPSRPAPSSIIQYSGESRLHSLSVT